MIALSTALVGPAASSPWLWLAETGVTIAVAAASWRFIEMPIMRDGLRVTVRRWMRLVAEASRPAGPRGRALPVMLASATALEAVLPGAYINARIDRQMATGLALIRTLAAAGRLRHVVVFSLGTNGNVTARQLRQLQQAVGPGRELVLVSTFGPQAWEHAVNAALAAAARHGRHTELADWHQAIAARPALLWPDGIHPRPAGARLYARVVLAAIKAGLTTGPRTSCRASASGSP